MYVLLTEYYESLKAIAFTSIFKTMKFNYDTKWTNSEDNIAEDEFVDATWNEFILKTYKMVPKKIMSSTGVETKFRRESSVR